MPPSSVDEFERVVLPFMDDAYTLARYLMRNEHDAQDAVQDAFLRAWRSFGDGTVREPRPWILMIVRNCCFSWKTKHRGDVVTYEEHVHGIADASPNPEVLAIAGSERDAIHAALNALPADFREVLVLREIQQLSYKEISQVTSMPVGTVMSRLARARRRLADALGGSSQAAG